jgi:hypothetical protein
MERNCTLWAACVKFTTNKSVTRLNRETEIREALSPPNTKAYEKSTRLNFYRY